MPFDPDDPFFQFRRKSGNFSTLISEIFWKLFDAD